MDREQVREWMKGRRLTNRTLAELLGITEDKVSKSLSTNGKPRLWKGDEALRLAELMREDAPKVRTEVRGTGLSPAQLRDAAGMPQAERIKVLGTAFGGEWTDDIDVETTELHLDQVIDLIDRPPSLVGDNEAYAVEVIGESMSPRYDPGEVVFVSTRSAARAGDDVIVQLRGSGDDQLRDQVVMVLIKRLVRETASVVVLRQFNPDRIFEVPKERVSQMHRVRGRL